jgi:selenocysteine lyase/cysteine desulfurase
MTPQQARSRFRPSTVYLNTATYGLAADTVAAALVDAIDRWSTGQATMAEYDEAVDRSRSLFAALVGVDPSRVAVANQASVLVGVVAADLPDGSIVLTPEGEFTSLLFPFLVHKGLDVRTVPLEALADAIDTDTTIVAFSLVQSSDGRLADVDAIEERAGHYGARLMVDATQATGWLPIDANRFDYMVVSAYKWLLSPRGTAFMTFSPTTDLTMTPSYAGWYAGEDPWESTYGTPLRLANSARRFDVSPAWLSWIGTAPALELISEIGIEAIHRHDVGLASQARRLLGLPRSDSAMLTVPMDDTASLTRQGISAAVRAGSVRVGFHLYNDETDVDALVAAVKGE